MRFHPQSTSSSVRLLIIGGVHGDERFGLTVFERLLQHASYRSRVSLLLANEPALQQNVRYVESDLNRSFPGNPHGTLEERLAHEIVPHLKNATHVLDIHTTTSDIQFLPIITCLASPVREILAHTDTKEIAMITPPSGTCSLIGRIDCGVSLEFGNDYAATAAAYQDILRVIDGILNQIPGTPKMRNVFHIKGLISNTILLPEGIRNFQYMPDEDCYPVLLHEKAYIGSHALKAIRKETMPL